MAAGTPSSRRAAVQKRRSTFTAAQERVARLLVKGYTNKEIGNELGISESTAKHHVSAVLIKLRARNRVEAALDLTVT